MKGDENPFVSRRRWLGQMSVPVVAASVGSLGLGAAVHVKAGAESPATRGAAVLFDRVADASVSGLAADGDPRAPALVRFVNTRDALLTASRVLKPAAVFLRVEGATSEGITVDGGDISKAAAPVPFGDGATARAVKLRT